jgi:hypothetical protein
VLNSRFQISQRGGPGATSSYRIDTERHQTWWTDRTCRDDEGADEVGQDYCVEHPGRLPANS